MTPSEQLKRVNEAVTELFPNLMTSPPSHHKRISKTKAASIKELLTSPAKQVKGLFQNWVFSPRTKCPSNFLIGTHNNVPMTSNVPEEDANDLTSSSCRRKLSFGGQQCAKPPPSSSHLNRTKTLFEARPRTLKEESHHHSLKRHHSLASPSQNTQQPLKVAVAAAPTDCFPFQKHYEEMFQFHKKDFSPATPMKRHDSLMEFTSPLAVRKAPSSNSSHEPTGARRHNTMPILSTTMDDTQPSSLAYHCDWDTRNFDELRYKYHHQKGILECKLTVCLCSIKIWIIQYLDSMDALFLRHSRDTALTLRLGKMRDLHDILGKWPNLSKSMRNDCFDLIDRYQKRGKHAA